MDVSNFEFWAPNGDPIARPGNALGSEDLVYSLISNITRSNGLKFYNHPSISILKEKSIHDIILIEDSIGSGDRVSRFIKGLMKSKMFLSWWSYGLIKIHIISYVRTRESEEIILKSCPGTNHGKRKYPKRNKINFYGLITYNVNNYSIRWGNSHNEIIQLCDKIDLGTSVMSRQ